MAIDEHRPFKSCVFCGNPKKADLTREHIFGKAVAKQYPVNHHWQTVKNTLFGPFVTKGGGPIINATAKLACGDCNSGPLSDIMDASLEPLMRLIDGTPHQLAPEDRAAVSRYSERVGLIADVMNSSYQLDAPNPDRLSPPLYSQAERERWTKGGPLPLDMHIYIGLHEGVLGLNPYTNSAYNRVRLEETQGGTAVEKRLTIELRFAAMVRRIGFSVNRSTGLFGPTDGGSLGAGCVLSHIGGQPPFAYMI